MENMALRDSDHSGDGNKRVCTHTCAHARTDTFAIDLSQLLDDLRAANKIAEERLCTYGVGACA